MELNNIIVVHYSCFFSDDIKEQLQRFKGIVTRDWGRLQMGSLDRSEFRTIPLEVYF
jgi:hypothetical protein